MAYRWFGLEDGRLDGQDFMIFYAEGANDWKSKAERWEKDINSYDDLNYVYIKLGSEDYTPVQTIQTEMNGTLKDTYTDRQLLWQFSLEPIGEIN